MCVHFSEFFSVIQVVVSRQVEFTQQQLGLLIHLLKTLPFISVALSVFCECWSLRDKVCDLSHWICSHAAASVGLFFLLKLSPPRSKLLPGCSAWAQTWIFLILMPVLHVRTLRLYCGKPISHVYHFVLILLFTHQMLVHILYRHVW